MSCRYPVSCHIFSLSSCSHFKTFPGRGLGEGTLPLLSPTYNHPCTHSRLIVQDIFMEPLLPHDQGSSLAQVGSFSCHCFLLSCSVPQPLSCILSPSSISWALATTSGLLTQTHSHFLPCLENAAPPPSKSQSTSLPCPMQKECHFLPGDQVQPEAKGRPVWAVGSTKEWGKTERKQEAGEKVLSRRYLQSGDARACHSGIGWNQPPPQELAAYHGFWMSQAPWFCLPTACLRGGTGWVRV